MLSNTLNTNEVKGSAGTEIEFTRLSISDRNTEFAKIGESPAAPHRLSIKHTETGSGLNKRRRSLLRVDITSVSDVDNVTPVVTSGYLVLDNPIGAVTTNAQAVNVIAELGSFTFTTGAATTVLFDGTGNGATALLTGGL